jgi:hypothetical protein
MSQQRHTAYHEAGHVIACDELQVNHGGLSIVPRKDGSLGRAPVEGGSHFNPRGADLDSPENEAAFRAWAEEQAVIDYAGHAAVVALLGVGSMSDASARAHGAGPDFEKARERLGADPKRIKQAKTRAQKIVTTRRGDIKTLVDAVLKYKRLDDEQVDCLLAGVPLRKKSAATK